MSKLFILLGGTLLVCCVMIPSTLGAQAEVDKAKETLKEIEEASVGENATCSADAAAVGELNALKKTLTDAINTADPDSLTPDILKPSTDKWTELKDKIFCSAGFDCLTVMVNNTAEMKCSAGGDESNCGKNPKCNGTIAVVDEVTCWKDACVSKPSGGNNLNISGLGLMLILLSIAIASSNCQFLFKSR